MFFFTIRYCGKQHTLSIYVLFKHSVRLPHYHHHPTTVLYHSINTMCCAYYYKVFIFSYTYTFRYKQDVSCCICYSLCLFRESISWPPCLVCWQKLYYPKLIYQFPSVPLPFNDVQSFYLVPPSFPTPFLPMPAFYTALTTVIVRAFACATWTTAAACRSLLPRPTHPHHSYV